MSVHGGIIATVYCNACGGRFETYEHHIRFCSHDCANRFWAPTRRHRPTALYAWAQAAFLDCLRRRQGEWVDRRELALALYGVDDPSTQHCLRMVLYRLRGTWAGDGLVIGCRTDRRRLQRDGATYYRLERDIAESAEEQTA